MYTSELLSYAGDKTIAAQFGDGKTVLPGPILRKVRDDDIGGILYRAAAWRHFPKDLWMVVYEDSTKWKDKKDMATWRGATTGCTGCYPDRLWANIGDDPRGSNDGAGTAKDSIKSGGYASRAELIRRIPQFEATSKREQFKIDVGVTAYKQKVKELWGHGSYLTRQQQIDAKMIIIAEGNDVATGSKWAMLSTSTVIMSKPGIYSWMMEDRLEPGVHYLEVKWDWSDLEEKVRWCLTNQDECEEIGRMGRCWMRRFLDEEREIEISKRVVEEAVRLQEGEQICKVDGKFDGRGGEE